MTSLVCRPLESDDEIRQAFGLMSALRDRIRAETFLPEVRRQQAQGYELVGGFLDGRLVALAGVRRTHTLARGEHLFVDDLVTAADDRGRGCGKAVMRWLAERAVADGIPRIHLDARITAKGFYEHLGFAFHTSVPCGIDADRLLHPPSTGPVAEATSSQEPRPSPGAAEMTVRIRRLRDDVELPRYETGGAAAFDLAAADDVDVLPGRVALVPTGLSIEVPHGMFLGIFARSSTPFKRGLMIANGVGVVDPDYCGPDDEVKIAVMNFGGGAVTVRRGDRIAQGIFLPSPRVRWQEASALRGDSRGGFGATGS
jgi:dUTP pyrophosphatase